MAVSSSASASGNPSASGASTGSTRQVSLHVATLRANCACVASYVHVLASATDQLSVFRYTGKAGSLKV